MFPTAPALRPPIGTIREFPDPTGATFCNTATTLSRSATDRASDIPYCQKTGRAEITGVLKSLATAAAMAYGWLKTRKKASLGRLLCHPRHEHGEIGKREFKFKIAGTFEALLRRPLNLEGAGTRKRGMVVPTGFEPVIELRPCLRHLFRDVR